MSDRVIARPASASTAVSGTAPASQRLMSIDALRGFDMFWIVGAEALVAALDHVRFSTGQGGQAAAQATGFLATQLTHCYWEGFHFYDLIFPLFVFIVGVSLVFSLSKTVSQMGRAAALKRVFLRSVALYLLGIFYYGGFSNSWPNMRVVGVLNRLALCYFFGGLIFCFFRPRAMAAICVGLLAGYWAIMTFVPIRNICLEKSSLAVLAQKTGITNAQTLYNQTTDQVTGHYEKGLNVANHFDFLYLPGFKYKNDCFDPEGLLSTIPAIATCLLGVFAGLLLRNNSVPNEKKVIYLIIAGVVAISLGWLWNLQFPVIKRIWTSSFVLVAGGYSAILLGLFYMVVDIWQCQKWCLPFVWIGTNPITVYLAANILDFNKLAQRFVGGDVKAYLDAHLLQGSGDLLVSLVGLALATWLVRFLYQRKIFLRV